MLTETEYLCWFGVDGLGEPLSFQAILYQSGVLPEHLVDHVVGVEVDRGDRDVSFGLRSTEHVRPENYRVTSLDWLLTELAEQDRRA